MGNFSASPPNPWVLTPTSISVAIVLISKEQADPAIQSLFNILLAFSTGLAGAFFAKRWDDIVEESILSTRGASAVRSLKLLLSEVNRVHKRTTIFIRCFNAEEDDAGFAPDLIKSNLEEIRDRCEGLMEEVLSSIENWTDFVPSADIKTEIGLISELRGDIDILEVELKDVNKKLEKSKESEAEAKQLQSEKRAFQKQLSDMKSQLRLHQYEIRPISYSTGSLLSSDIETWQNIAATLGSHLYRLCRICNTPYPSSEDDEEGLCPNCKEA